MRPSATQQHSLLSLNLLTLAALLATVVTLLLTGCGMGPRLIPSSTQGSALQGRVHGGQQAIAGSRVYLLAAGTSAYGAASTSLLTSGSSFDSLGFYVLSDAVGNFSITGDYTCTPGQQVYALARYGDAGGGSNSAIGLMAVLGNCPGAGTFYGSVPFLEINEVSTVAAAFALAGFATDSTHIANDEKLLNNFTAASAVTGMANAFANAANLADLGSGTALLTTPAGNGIAPQAAVNTLANILAACVNTADPVPGLTVSRISHDALTGHPHGIAHSAACQTLLHTARSHGSAGLYPFTTADAAIYIAHNPAANVSTLYDSIAPQPPFTPTLSPQPDDFTLTLAFTPTQLASYAIAFDAAGNLWYTYGLGVAELSPLGTDAPGSPFADPDLTYPLSLAIDTSNNIWTADYVHQTLTEFNSSGSLLQSAAITGYSYPTSLAFDPSGNLWASNLGSRSVTETTSTGSLIATYTGNGTLSDPFQVLSDGSGNIWLLNPNHGNFILLNNDGTPNADSPLSASGISPAYSDNPIAALDSSGNLWTLIAGSANIGAIASSGMALPNFPFGIGSTPEGYFPQPEALALDGQNNVWAAITYEFDDDVHTGSPQPLSLHPNNFTGNINTLYGLTPSGNSLLAYNLPGSPNALAVDPSGNLWFAVSGQGFYEIVGLAAPVITPSAAAVAANKIATLP